MLRVAAVRGVGEVAQPRAADEGAAARQRGDQPRELLPEAEAAQVQPQARCQTLHVHAAVDKIFSKTYTGCLKKMSFSGKTAIITFKLIQNAKVGGVLENSGYLLHHGH